MTGYFCENSQIIHPEKKVANPTVTQSGECIAQRTLKKSSLGNKLLALKYKILKGDLQKVDLVVT